MNVKPKKGLMCGKGKTLHLTVCIAAGMELELQIFNSKIDTDD